MNSVSSLAFSAFCLARIEYNGKEKKHIEVIAHRYQSNNSNAQSRFVHVSILFEY